MFHSNLGPKRTVLSYRGKYASARHTDRDGRRDTMQKNRRTDIRNAKYKQLVKSCDKESVHETNYTKLYNVQKVNFGARCLEGRGSPPVISILM